LRSFSRRRWEKKLGGRQKATTECAFAPGVKNMGTRIQRTQEKGGGGRGTIRRVSHQSESGKKWTIKKKGSNIKCG